MLAEKKKPKNRRRKGPKSIPGFEARDQHGPLAGIEGMRQGPVIVHGSQVKDADGKIGNPYRVRNTLDALFSNDRLTKTTREAGRRFQDDFAAANLAGMKAVDWLNAGPSGGPGGIPERTVMARDRVMAAIFHLGGVGQPQAEVAWHVIGLGSTIKDYAQANQLISGRSSNTQFVAGLVVGACGSLAVHYKM